ncbi:MAG: glycosyltransferase family 39 protein [Thermoleophilaceae bacterium]|nr:glycosyltransferase family 39 protein [Thermoleophilaceae bacterium]
MSTVGAQRPVPAGPARLASRRGFWPPLLAIVAAGVVIRVLYTLVEAPWPPPGLDDQFYFSALPKLLAEGHGFVAPFRFAFRDEIVRTAEHPPLYSVVLAGPAKLGLTSPDAQRLAGAAFGAGTVAAVGLLGRRLGGRRAGLLAAGLAAVYPTLIAADGALMSESLLGLLVALSLLAAYRLVEAPTVGRAATLGAVAGLAALTRGEALLLLPLLLLPVLFRPARGPAAIVVVLAFVVVVAPWTVRNWIVFDRPVLVATNSGTAVAGANCDATYRGDKLGGWWPPCIREHPGMNEAEHHSQALADGVRYAGHHLDRLPVVLAARLGRVWSLYDPFQIPEGRSARVQKLGVLMFFALLPLAVAGALTLRRRGVGVWIILVPFAVVSVTALATYGNVRFREPAELSLVVLAAVAIDRFLRRRRMSPPAVA